MEAHYEAGPYASVLQGVRASLPDGRFRFDTAYGAVTWENFRDGQHELLTPTVSGYDHRTRADNLARFGNGLAQFLGLRP